MTSLSFLGTQLVYFLLGLVSLVDTFRWRDRPRLMVALTFGACAIFEIYAAWMTVRGARHTAGVTRRRLALAAVQRLVQRHGGRIWAKAALGPEVA